MRVREDTASCDDPGRDEHPAGAVAGPVAADELRADLGPETAPKAGVFRCG